MKLRISVWRVTWRYLIAALAIIVLLCGFGFTIFLTRDADNHIIFAKFGPSQIIFLSVIFIIVVVGYILSLTAYYYVIENDCFIVKRFGKEVEYSYKNIDFIDIETSKRKKYVIFYTKIAKMRYLIGDKDGVLLETLIKKCPNTMSIEEFRRTHPEEKY